MSLTETGTPVTGPFFNVTVAVPLYVVAVFFFVGLPLILKSVILCLWGALPFNITMLKVALNVGEVELIFLKSQAPETIHAGFPSFAFCRLAIVPDFEPVCCALNPDTDDIIVAAAAAMNIADSNSLLSFDIIKERRSISFINRTTHEDFETKLGRLRYSVGKYDKLTRATIPIPPTGITDKDVKSQFYLLLILDIDSDATSIIERKVLPLIERSKEIFD